MWKITYEKMNARIAANTIMNATKPEKILTINVPMMRHLLAFMELAMPRIPGRMKNETDQIPGAPEIQTPQRPTTNPQAI